jgi:hypothetical protein
MPKPAKKQSVYARFPPPKYKVGDWVQYMLSGKYPQVVQVIEYSGPLGPGGEHVYRHRQVYDDGQVREFSMSESDVEPVAAPDPLPVPAHTSNPDW